MGNAGIERYGIAGTEHGLSEAHLDIQFPGDDQSVLTTGMPNEILGRLAGGIRLVDHAEQLVVTENGAELLTLFPAEELVVTNAY